MLKKIMTDLKLKKKRINENQPHGDVGDTEKEGEAPSYIEPLKNLFR
jgi:hypothetical protein